MIFKINFTSKRGLNNVSQLVGGHPQVTETHFEGLNMLSGCILLGFVDIRLSIKDI